MSLLWGAQVSAHAFICDECQGAGECAESSDPYARVWRCEHCFGRGEVILECDGCDECPKEMDNAGASALRAV